MFILIPTTSERRPRLEKCLEAIKASTIPSIICTMENTGGGWVKNIHEMLEGINGVCFLIGDDCIIAPNCLEKLQTAYEALPNKEEWLLQPYEQFSEGKIAQMPFAHSDLLKKYIHKGYFQNYSDTELTEVMKKKGRYLYVPEAKLDHQHFIGGAVYDETYKLSHERGQDDKILFEIRKANDYQ